MDSIHTFAAWAVSKNGQDLLAKMLASPMAAHSISVHAALPGGIRDAHAAVLCRVAQKLSFKKLPWSSSSTRRSDVVYHI